MGGKGRDSAQRQMWPRAWCNKSGEYNFEQVQVESVRTAYIYYSVNYLSVKNE